MRRPGFHLDTRSRRKIRRYLLPWGINSPSRHQRPARTWRRTPYVGYSEEG
jgi:hypothetical protein